MRLLLSGFALLVLGVPSVAQTPDVFDVSNVVVGSQRIPTQLFYAAGKWSDAGEHLGGLSTEIHCYKALGFCDVASAEWSRSHANVKTESFDILRWDRSEIIAVDSFPACVISTLRVDLSTKRVTLNFTDKGARKDTLCKGVDRLPAVVLWGVKDEADAFSKSLWDEFDKANHEK